MHNQHTIENICSSIEEILCELNISFSEKLVNEAEEEILTLSLFDKGKKKEYQNKLNEIIHSHTKFQLIPKSKESQKSNIIDTHIRSLERLQESNKQLNESLEVAISTQDNLNKQTDTLGRVGRNNILVQKETEVSSSLLRRMTSWLRS
jgi:hypothetical protein